jgi:YVTN family beta-propeller protein
LALGVLATAVAILGRTGPATAQPQVTGIIQIGQGGLAPEGVAANPNTNRVYVANYDSDNVSVIDGAGNAVVATVPMGYGGPYGVAVNPNTNRIYFANRGSTTLRVMDGATNSVVATVHVGSVPGGVAADPNANRIYVANCASNTVSVVDGATNSVASQNCCKSETV